MGIRETQIFGLTEEAHKFLEENCKRTERKECPTCHNVTGGQRIEEQYADESDLGMFDDGPKLDRYQLKDGRTAKEVVQASPWSSGPCIFLCLEIDGKSHFEWAQKEIDEA